MMQPSENTPLETGAIRQKSIRSATGKNERQELIDIDPEGLPEGMTKSRTVIVPGDERRRQGIQD